MTGAGGPTHGSTPTTEAYQQPDLIALRTALRRRQLLADDELRAIGGLLASVVLPAGDSRGTGNGLALGVVQTVDEYLDAVLRVDPEVRFGWLLPDVAGLADRAVRNLRYGTRPSDPERLLADGCSLAIAVTLTLLAARDSHVPSDQRQRIEDAAWKLLQEANNHGTATPAAKTWAIRVAADALDLCFHRSGHVLLRKVARTQSEQTWPLAAVGQQLGRQTPNAKPDPIDIAGATTTFVAAPPAAALYPLPLTSATATERAKSGRGLVGTYWRRTHFEPGRLLVLAGGLIAPLGVLLLISSISQLGSGQLVTPGLGAFPFALDTADLLNIVLQLFGTSATITIALAIGDKFSTDEQWVAANHWSRVGFALVLLCGWTSTTSVGLYVLGHLEGPYTTPALSLIVSLLTCALAVGVSNIQQKRDLEVAYTRHAASQLRQSIAKARSLGAPMLDHTSTPTRMLLFLVLFCLLPGLAWGAIRLVAQSSDGVSLVEGLAPLAGAFASTVIGLAAAMLSYEIARGRYRMVGGRSRLLLHVPFWGAMTALLYALGVISLIIAVQAAHSPQTFSVTVIGLICLYGPSLAILAVPLSTKLRPRSLRRIVHLHACQALEGLRRNLDVQREGD